MADEWRVILIFHVPPGAGRRPRYPEVCDVLRSRLGKDITVSADRIAVFLYARTEDTAGQAEQVAREVLAEQGLTAEFALEQWDPSGQAWQGPRSAAADYASAVQEDNHGLRRVRSVGWKALNGVLNFIDSGSFRD